MVSPSIRQYCPETDESCVSATWKHSYRANNPDLHWCRDGEPGATPYFEAMNRRVKATIGNCEVLIACNPHDKEHIWGWVCFRDNVVHYCWVRRTYRRKKVASALIGVALNHDTNNFTASHWTKVCEFLRGNVTYNPSEIIAR